MDTKTNLKNKQLLNTILTVLEIILIAALLAISLVAMLTVETNANPTNWFMEFINFLQNNILLFFILIVLPLIFFFLLNGYFLIKIIYTAKHEEQLEEATKKSMDAVNVAIEEAKRLAREELIREMQAEKEKAAKENSENK